MAYVIAATIIALVVSVVYVGSVWASFRQVRSDKKTEGEGHAPAAQSSHADNGQNESSFSWKALISIVLSSTILYLAGKSAALWHYIPFIAIGSAIAVIVAFSIDLRKKA
jgi:hypothetical protein